MGDEIIISSKPITKASNQTDVTAMRAVVRVTSHLSILFNHISLPFIIRQQLKFTIASTIVRMLHFIHNMLL